VRRIGIILLSLLTLAIYPAQAQKSNAPQGAPALDASQVVAAVRAYRLANQARIVGELVDLLSIPNVASDAPNIERNAEKLVEMLGRRGFRTRLLPIEGRGPVVYGALETPGAARTVIFYCHYDGQPVEPTLWTGTKPFEPALRTNSIDAGGRLIPFPKAPARYEDDWRIYARSAADDKAPIVALLAAVDALRANRIPLAVNLKVVLDGEEEAGSPHLKATLLAHRELLAGDLLIAADGPVDQSGRPLVDFGNRGVLAVNLAVFGPLHPLHSGHYGNWVPNPAMRLAQLLASMKDADGHVLIEGFYDGAEPLGEAERSAIEQAPANDAELLGRFGIAKPDGGGKKLLELLNEPSLNIDGLESGWVGPQGKTIIPDRATASLDLRLVKDIQPDQQFARLVAHIRKQGYVVLDHEPTLAERLKNPRIAEVTRDKGYPATRTPMDLPVAQALLRVVDDATGQTAVRLPLLGGSVPMYIFENLGLPVIGVPIVNFDDNQHSPNENLRLREFWRGIEIDAAILANLRW
jgi:acetylornithine deacetylase/succinyl-diaminopimelate desuccinylase-like protein